jgi:chromosome segregation ATPase
MADDITPPRGRLRFDWVINFGALVNCAVIVAGAIAWIVTGANNAAQNGRDLAALKVEVAGQLKDLRADLGQNISDMRTELKNLPDQRAKEENLERWVTQLDAKLSALDQRLGTVERSVIELRSDLNAVTQASRAKLPK